MGVAFLDKGQGARRGILMSLCVRKRLNLRDALPGPILLDLEVVMALEVEPELGRGSEVPGEPQSRVCTYRPLAAHNVVHAGGIHDDILGQPVRRYLKRLKELELQDPARVHRRVNSLSFASHGLSSSLVVVNYLNVVGIAAFE